MRNNIKNKKRNKYHDEKVKEKYQIIKSYRIAFYIYSLV